MDLKHPRLRKSCIQASMFNMGLIRARRDLRWRFNLDIAELSGSLLSIEIGHEHLTKKRRLPRFTIPIQSRTTCQGRGIR
jgi:hypothetical protein